MKKFIIIAFTGLFICLSISAMAQDKPAENPYAKANLKDSIISAANNTYGYNILMDGKTIIHQPAIPAMPGNEGFKTKTDAEKVAALVISKIRKGEMPPTVTVEELKNLNVINNK